MLKNFLKNNEQYLLGALIIILLCLAIATNILTPNDNELAKLGWSFLHGKTYFINNISNADIIFFADKIYLAIPPLPAAIFMPLDLIWQKPAGQNILGSLLLFPAFILIYLLARKQKFSCLNSLWLTLAYFFGSVFIISAYFPGNANFFCHVLTTIFLCLALLEFFGKKRYLLIGILIGLTFLTRQTAGISGIFFLSILLFDKNLNWRHKLKQITFFSLPIILCGLLLLGFNYLRFNSAWQNGYALSANYQSYPAIRTHGLFSYKYIPDNLYYYFLEGLAPEYARVSSDQPLYRLKPPYFKKNTYGSLSFFLIAPIFIFLLRADFKNKTIRYLLISSCLVLLILLNYYYNGWPQIGPRYFNDFLPLLFTALLLTLQQRSLNYKHKIIITLSAIFNSLLLLFF